MCLKLLPELRFWYWSTFELLKTGAVALAALEASFCQRALKNVPRLMLFCTTSRNALFVGSAASNKMFRLSFGVAFLDSESCQQGKMAAGIYFREKKLFLLSLSVFPFVVTLAFFLCSSNNTI